MPENSDKDNQNISNDESITIGADTPNETRIEIQTLQRIYHELTDKTEDVSKFYDDPFQLGLDDLRQLNHRITQCYEQYHVKADGCSVKIYHSDNTQDTFSSFEKFIMFCAAATSPIESILIEYKLLIILPKGGKLQNYTISIRLASRVALERKMSLKAPFQLSKLLKSVGARSAMVNITYIDYAVARNLLTTLDQWFAGLPQTHTPKALDFINRKSAYIPTVSRYSVGLLTFIFIYNSSHFFVPPTATMHDNAIFILCSFVCLFAAYNLAHHIGQMTESSLDNWSPLSYLNITSGDKKLIQEAEWNNKMSITWASAKFLATQGIAGLVKAAIFWLSHS